MFKNLMDCHEFLWGVKETCLYDNMKTVVFGTDDQGEVVWNERFARFAAHHGFLIHSCYLTGLERKGRLKTA